MRNLQYIVVEIGRCQNCGRDAGRHSIEGICATQKIPHQRSRETPEKCYRAMQVYGFVDMDSPHDAGVEHVA